MPPETTTEINPPPGPNPIAKQKTPPNSSPPKVDSTPLNQGAAQNVRAGGAIPTTVDENIVYLEHDIGNTHVPFLSMLKALLALQYQREVEPYLKERSSQVEDDAKEFAARYFSELLREAVTFCNDPKRSTGLKNDVLEAFSAKSESARYTPFIRGLNDILSSFQDRTLGGFMPSNDFVFMVNDPISLKSSDISPSTEALEVTEKAPRCTKRKPDAIDPQTDHLEKLLPECAGYTLDQWIELIKENPEKLREARKRASTSDRTSWDDISQAWEFKFIRSLAAAHLAMINPTGGFKVEDLLDHDNTPALKTKSGGEAPKPKRQQDLRAEPSQTPSNVQKRAREVDHDTDEGSTGTKRLKSAGNSAGNKSAGESARRGDSHRISHLVPTRTPQLSAPLQCGLYGIELMRSRWDRTHAVVILLEDERLSLRWHDPQGCIGTTKIDVVAQLPLLVTMILMFQRFGKRMRGEAGWKLQANVDGKDINYTLPPEARAGWELKGRHQVFATPLAPADGSEPLSDGSSRRSARLASRASVVKPRKDLFFKLSWREDSRDDEALVVKTAKERAKHYLGDHAGDVLNHLPEIKHSENDPLFSTGHIRGFLQLTTDGARVPSFMLSQTLQPLDQVEPVDIIARVWEIIRCLFLLWQIGIAHGDISYWNLMIRNTENGTYGVVNDFDLAAIMTPGQASPTKQGFERTGTKPFMALDLLQVSVGEVVQRRWAHDLESVIWCLVWYVIEGRPRWDWRLGTYQQVGDAKTKWIKYEAMAKRLPGHYRTGTEHLWAALADAVFDWHLRQDLVARERLPYSDKANIEVIKGHFPCPKRPEGEEWDWMEFGVKQEDIREVDRIAVEVTE